MHVTVMDVTVKAVTSWRQSMRRMRLSGGELDIYSRAMRHKDAPVPFKGPRRQLRRAGNANWSQH
jgi:hypothetical protein